MAHPPISVSNIIRWRGIIQQLLNRTKSTSKHCAIHINHYFLKFSECALQFRKCGISKEPPHVVSARIPRVMVHLEISDDRVFPWILVSGKGGPNQPSDKSRVDINGYCGVDGVDPIPQWKGLSLVAHLMRDIMYLRRTAGLEIRLFHFSDSNRGFGCPARALFLSFEVELNSLFLDEDRLVNGVSGAQDLIVFFVFYRTVAVDIKTNFRAIADRYFLVDSLKVFLDHLGMCQLFFF